jgi:phosphoenolpyruvate-protein phosphotransferase
MRKGVPLVPGVAVARAYCVDLGPGTRPAQRLDAAALSTEVSRFESACTAAAQEIDARITRVAQELGEEHTAIFRSHRLLLGDPALISKVESIIRNRRMDADTALWEVLGEYGNLLAQVQEEYLKQRLADLRCVVGFLRRHLDDRNQAAPPFDPAEPLILVTSEVLPSHLLVFQHLNLAGIVTEVGGGTGHAAILARSLGIPTVSGLPGILREIHTGDLVALDAREGYVHINPGSEEENAYRRLQDADAEWRDRLIEHRDQGPVTVDDIRVELLANVNGPADTALAARVGADGVGLYRTEYLFLMHSSIPDEEEQLAAYRAVVQAAPNRSVVLRTLDVGADKEVPYLGRRHEANPALGWRGTRLLLAHPEFFQTQLRAVLRAGCFGKLSLLVPMISLLEEIQWTKRMLDAARRTLQTRGEPFAQDVPVGVMVEVPAAAACLDDWLDEVDFVSIGTNDLIQYLMAADRNNPQVAHLCEPFSPAVWRVLHSIIGSCVRRGKPVTLCGEMAGQPRYFLPLFGMGLRRFSMSPALVPSIKEVVRRTHLPMAQAAAKQVLQLRTVGKIRDYLTEKTEQVWPDPARPEPE